MRSPEREPRLTHTLVNDLRRGDLRRTISRDFRELKEFMLNEERKARLRTMGRLKRAFFFTWWLLKSLLLKLTPARRLLLAVALVLLLAQDSFDINAQNFRMNLNFNLLSGGIILFILMLELKDKLLAKEELEAGRAVQNALMPPRSPDVPGWQLWLFTRSANEVGGDLVDFIKIDDERFGVAVGDVAGKGLRAALMTAKLQSSVRALVREFDSLPTLFAKLNQIFCRDSLPSLFASAVYVEIRANDGRIRLVNAGHLPPMLVHDGQVSAVPKGDPALGLIPAAHYHEHHLTLEPNDFVFITSDGLTEARKSDAEFFGEERLKDLLLRYATRSTEEIGNGVVGELDRFVGEQGIGDDISIAILKRL